MSLKEASFCNIVLKQFIYKMNSNISMLYTLIIIQIIGLSLSLGGIINTSSGNGQTTIHITGFSAYIPITLTFMSIFVMTLLMTTKYYRNMDSTLVSSRVSSNLSNLLLITVFTGFGAITGALSDVLLRVAAYFIKDKSRMIAEGFHMPITDILMSALSIFLYCLLLSSIAYLSGSLIQLHASFAFILPVAFISTIILEARKSGGIFYSIAKWFTLEPSLPIFSVKILVTAALVYSVSMLISDKLEVRK